MPADISTSLKDWSTTAGSNLPTGGTLVSGNLDDNLRAVQAAVRADVAGSDTIASAGTTDIGVKDAGTLTVTGVTTITGLGTVSAGICKRLVFGGVLTLTHNATSLILPSGANITTAAGDCAEFVSLGSGNWRCLNYMRANGGLIGAADFVDGTVSAPGLKFTSDPNTGIYRVGADSLGISAGGVQRAAFSATTVALASAGTASVSAAGAMSLTTSAGGQVTIDAAGDLVIEGANLIASTPDSAGSGTGSMTFACGDDSSSGLGGSVLISAGDSAAGSGGDIQFTPGSGVVPAFSGELRFMAAGGSNYALRIPGGSGHLTVDNNQNPTITSGAGSGPSIVGSDTAFKVTMGTAPTTSVRVTFKYGFVNDPIVVAQYQTSNIAVRCVPTTSYVDLIFASAPAAGGVVHVMCLGYELP